MISFGISSRFQLLSQFKGQVTHALLTRPPLTSYSSFPKKFQLGRPFDLHVLSTPPAFVLSQDQTLHVNPYLHEKLVLAQLLLCTSRTISLNGTTRSLLSQPPLPRDDKDPASTTEPSQAPRDAHKLYCSVPKDQLVQYNSYFILCQDFF